MFYLKTKRKWIALLLVPLISACQKQGFQSESLNASASTQNGAALLGQVSLNVLDSNGHLVYSDGNPSTALNLKAGSPYSLQLQTAGVPAGTAFSLQSTQINVVVPSTTTIDLQPGNNSFSAAASGDYKWKLVVTPPGGLGLTRFYQAAVSCANPSFSAASLDGSKIAVSSAGGNNLFNFSSTGVASSADGQGPYKCAWDLTGSGIVNTAFQDCDAPLNGAYVNYVDQRNVALIVKDSCNTAHTVSASRALNYVVPSMPGNVFIFGQTSNAQGLASGDSRVDGVKYLATNAGGHNIVQSTYGASQFTIASFLNYGMPSSVDFGMRIKLSGLTGSVNVATASGNVSAASAKIASVEYKTDQAGDQSPSVTFKGSQCSLSQQGARVQFVTGQPCAAGTTGSNNKVTVEVWGHYSCVGISSAGGSINIEGEFDGYDDIADSCSGGGGGGGGIVPIQL